MGQAASEEESCFWPGATKLHGDKVLPSRLTSETRPHSGSAL